MGNLDSSGMVSFIRQIAGCCVLNCFGSTILRPKAVTLPLLLLIALRIKKENGCVFVDGIEFTEFRWPRKFEFVCSYSVLKMIFLFESNESNF